MLGSDRMESGWLDGERIRLARWPVHCAECRAVIKPGNRYVEVYIGGRLRYCMRCAEET